MIDMQKVCDFDELIFALCMFIASVDALIMGTENILLMSGKLENVTQILATNTVNDFMGYIFLGCVLVGSVAICCRSLIQIAHSRSHSK